MPSGRVTSSSLAGILTDSLQWPVGGVLEATLGRGNLNGDLPQARELIQMTVAAKRYGWQETIDVSVIMPILVLLLALPGQGARAEPTIKLSRVGESLDGHGTTRTTVRRVFHHDGYWYVFCGDVRDRVYHSFFVTGTDGINWSQRKIGSGGDLAGGQYGAPDLPETAIVYGDRVYGCYSEKGELCIRSGTLARGDIHWSGGQSIVPGPGDKTTRDFYFYYPDIMIEGDGSLSISLRHHHMSGTTHRLDPALVISANPGDITKWRAPRDLITFALPEKADAHENIPLCGGRRVVIVRSHRGVTDEELYKPGCPGGFYAVHYDGTTWLEPVDSAKLQSAMQYMEDALDDPKTPDAKEDGIQFACVIRNGRMIWPNATTPAGHGSDLQTPCQIYSVTKTFGTGVLGLLLDQGLAKLDTPANAIVDVDLTREDGQGEKKYPSYDKITLRHLATFTDGFGDVRPKWPKPGMYYPFDPKPPRFSPPGSKFAYNSSPQVLAYCLTKLICNRFSQPPHSWPKEKCNLDHYFERFVARRIGMARDGWRWSDEFPDPGQHMIDLSNPEGLDIRPISQSMFMSAGTMARWGHLFLNRGNWDGNQIICRSYVDLATTIQVPREIEPDNRHAGYREVPGRYGFMWWINGQGGWTAEGPRRPPVLRWPDAPARTDPTKGVYAAHGMQVNYCMVIHTLNSARSGKEVPANMVVVRLAFGILPDGRRSTPGRFTSDEYSRFLKMLGDALLPEPKGKRPT